MSGRVEVCRDSEAEADQRHEGSDGVHDKDGGQGMARIFGQREVGVWDISKETLCGFVSAVVQGA